MTVSSPGEFVANAVSKLMRPEGAPTNTLQKGVPAADSHVPHMWSVSEKEPSSWQP